MVKKTLLSFVLMVTGIAVLGYFAPWWVPVLWIIVVAFLLKLNIRNGVITGGLSFALVWLVMARYMDVRDEAGIIEKTGTLMGGLTHQQVFIVVLVISLITGSLAGWFGSALRDYFNRTSRASGN